MTKFTSGLCCLLLFATGCGPSNKPLTPDEEGENTLVQVGEMYRSYQISAKKPPRKFSDLVSVRAVSGNGYEAVRTGGVVLRYEATLPDTKEEPGDAVSDAVLAYQKQVPESGGKVLMLDRRVKTMTADEFKAAKKAGKG